MQRNARCFFYFDEDDDDAMVIPLCLECGSTTYRGLGWYYEGRLGPWEYRCGKCENVILEGIADET